MSELPVLTTLQVQPSKQLIESFRCLFLYLYNSSLYVCNEVICASLYDVNPTKWNWTNKINQINMCTPARAYVTFTFSSKYLIFSCLCIWKWNLRIYISPLPLQASSSCRHGHELPSLSAKTWDQSLTWLLVSNWLTVHLSALLLLQRWEVQRVEDRGSWLRVWPPRAVAHWRLSLAGAFPSVAGRGGASHRQRRMMRWQMWREAELLLVEG